MINEEKKIKIWKKGRIVEGLDPDMFRMDVCGALMIYSKFGNTEDEFGWVVDHIYPRSKGGDDKIGNLRPMQARNNESKGNDYPVYFRAVKYVDNRNIPNKSQCRVSLRVRNIINNLYGLED